MSYFYAGSARTQKGKIIYLRKRHEFSACDLRRIADKVRWPESIHQQLCYIGAVRLSLSELLIIPNEDLSEAIEKLQDILGFLEGQAQEFAGFGGGEAGGGGAGGFFGLPLDVTLPEEREE